MDWTFSQLPSASTTWSFIPFVLVRDGLQARLTRAVYYELVGPAATETKEGKKEMGVWSGGAFFSFPKLRASGKD